MVARSRDYSQIKLTAIKLRWQGYSYSEIAKNISVSKSTLSLWLRDIVLSDISRKRINDRMRAGQPYGANAQKRLRIERTKSIKLAARHEISSVSRAQMMLVGVALYWAEGSKQKENNPSQLVSFNNSDPQMIQVYLKWLTDCLGITKNRIAFEIYSHENIRNKEREVIKHWSNITGYPKRCFVKIRYKKNKRSGYRKNKGENYHGLLRVTVRKSTDLNRKISGWIEGMHRKIVC